jgi:hypothetical protein
VSDRWLIEQRVRKVYEEPWDDDARKRLHDGYHLVLDTPMVDRRTCRECHLPMVLPTFETREFYCGYCLKTHDEKVRYVDGYWPLVHRTLEHLERTSPKRGTAWAKENDAADAALERSQTRYRQNLLEDIGNDYWKRISGALTFGYSGRSFS